MVNVAAVTPRFKTLIESERANSTPRFKSKQDVLSQKSKQHNIVNKPYKQQSSSSFSSGSSSIPSDITFDLDAMEIQIQQISKAHAQKLDELYHRPKCEEEKFNTDYNRIEQAH